MPSPQFFQVAYSYLADSAESLDKFAESFAEPEIQNVDDKLARIAQIGGAVMARPS